MRLSDSKTMWIIPEAPASAATDVQAARRMQGGLRVGILDNSKSNADHLLRMIVDDIKAKLPVSHPIFLEHPITGKRVLYCNPGYSVRINELPEDESDRMLDFLFAHQTQAKYRYAARWRVGDVLMWDNMGMIHNAVADYGPDEHRLIKCCQVMATRFFDEPTGARLS